MTAKPGLPGTYDAEVDAAYLYVVADIADGAAVAQVVVEDDRVDGTIIVDLDSDGRILGFEILGARSLLAPSVLEALEAL